MNDGKIRIWFKDNEMHPNIPVLDDMWHMVGFKDADSAYRYLISEKAHMKEYIITKGVVDLRGSVVFQEVSL